MAVNEQTATPQIYRVVSDEGFDFIDPTSHDLASIFPLGGRRLTDDWAIPEVRIADWDSAPLHRGDFVGLAFGNALVLRDRAANVLGGLLETDTEFLDVRAGREHLTLVNVTTVLDILDEARSKIGRLPSGAVMDVREFAFRPVTDLPPVFKLPILDSVFASSAMVDAVRGASLTGVVFRPVARGTCA